MKPLFYFATILSFFDLSKAQICSTVEWSNDLPSGVCYQYSLNEDTIYLRECDNGQKCDNEHSNSLASVEIDQQTHYCVDINSVQGDRYDGEACLRSNECASGICSAGVCIGKEKGSPWTKTGECGIQLTCRGNTWVNQSNPGEVCTEESHCVNDAGCYNGTCAKYFSLPDGTTFTGTLNNYVWASGYASTSLGACIAAPVSQNDIGDSWTSSSQWGAEGDLSQGYCYCGLTQRGLAYCGALQGDDEYSQFVSAFKDVMEKNYQWHSEISYSSRCPQLSGTGVIKELTKRFYQYYYRHKLISVPQCVLNVLFPAVEDSYVDSGDNLDSEEKSSETTSDGSLGTVGIVVIIVVIVAILILGVVTYIIIRKCKTDSSEQDSASTNGRNIAPSSIIYQPNNSSHARNLFEVTDITDDEKSSKEPIKGMPIGAPTDVNTLHVIANAEPEFVTASPAEQDESESDHVSHNGDLDVHDLEATNDNLLPS